MLEESKTEIEKLMRLAVKGAEDLKDLCAGNMCKVPDNFLDSKEELAGKSDAMMAMVMFGLFQMQLTGIMKSMHKLVSRKMGKHMDEQEV